MSFLSSKKSSKSGRPGSSSNSRSSTSSKTKTSSRESSNPSSADNDDDGWNAWEWSAQWQREWRSRKKTDGSWEYQYRQPDPSDDTPRFIGTGDSLATIGEDVVSGSDFTHSPQPPGTFQPLPSQSGPGQYPSAVEHDSGYGYNTASRPMPINRSPGYLQGSPNLQQGVSSSHGTRIPGMSTSTSVLLQSSSRHQPIEEEDDYSDDDTVAESAQEFEGLQISQNSGSGGGSSYSQRSMVDDEGIPVRQSNPLLNAQGEDDIYEDDTTATVNPTQFTYKISSDAPKTSSQSLYSQTDPPNIEYASYATSNTEESSMVTSPPTERTPTVDTTYIVGDATVDEESITSKTSQRDALHGSFKIHNGKEFKLYRVFKILWTEPKGQTAAPKGTEVVSTIYGEQCYTSIRRFVIFKPMQGHCLCLPILTYNRRGTAKGGAKPQDHAIIYTAGKKGEKPKETKGEEKLLKKAIRMEPRTQRDQLASTSRLNYAKVYTVEYNVKVCFIGHIAPESIKYFTRDYNIVHQPLPEAETEYSDDSQDFEQLGEREPEPQNLDDRRGSEPSHRYRESQEQPNQEQHKRKKKEGK